MDNIWCLKCKKKTPNEGKPVIGTAKNGRRYAKTKCAVCGTTKMTFLPKNQGGGCDCEDSEEESEKEVKRPTLRSGMTPVIHKMTTVEPIVLKKSTRRNV